MHSKGRLPYPTLATHSFANLSELSEDNLAPLGLKVAVVKGIVVEINAQHFGQNSEVHSESSSNRREPLSSSAPTLITYCSRLLAREGQPPTTLPQMNTEKTE